MGIVLGGVQASVGPVTAGVMLFGEDPQILLPERRLVKSDLHRRSGGRVSRLSRLSKEPALSEVEGWDSTTLSRLGFSLCPEDHPRHTTHSLFSSPSALTSITDF